MDQVKFLARKHGVYQKLDPLELEHDHKPWLECLTELDSIVFPQDTDVDDVDKVDAHKFYAGSKIKQDLVHNLEPGFDFAPIKRRLADIADKESFIVEKPQVTPPEIPGGTLKAHIIDAAWENLPGKGAHIFLYTRDVNSDITTLVTTKYNDYFYIEIDDAFARLSDIKKSLSGYEWYMREKRFPETNYEPEKTLNGIKNLIIRTEVVDDVKSVYGYKPDTQRFLKVTTVSPTVSTIIFNGLSKKHPEWKFYEAKTDYVNKFLTSHGLSGCAPVKCVEPELMETNMLSTCDRHVVVSEEQVLSWEDGPIYEPKTFYYDIECLSLDVDTFPTADCCPVIQISYLLAKGFNEVSRGVLCLHDTPGSDIYESFDSEDQLLIKFSQIIREFNPDAVTGFNSNNFDMPYIMDRMDVLGIAFAKKLSRRRDYTCEYKRTFKQSKQFGTKEVIKYVMPGRLMFDFFEVIKADVTKKLRSYSLKHICATYLGDDNKEDLRYRDIPDLFKVPEGRAKIASYCMKDTVLLLELDKKLMLGVNTWALTRVLGVTPDVAINRGLVHKLMCKLKQYTERYNFIIPTFTEDQKPKFEGKYQGAFVLDPDVGFIEHPVCVLDYASLYPSLMIYYNLSYDSYLPPSDPGAMAWKADNPNKWEEMDGGYCFVKPTEYFGIIPRLEQELGKQRKAAKKKKAEATDPLAKAVYDGEQLAVKVIMNSLYGMLGSPTATVPCVEIASSITAMGRHNLMAAKAYVEKNYCEFTGEPKENAAKVVYGDVSCY